MTRKPTRETPFQKPKPRRIRAPMMTPTLQSLYAAFKSAIDAIEKRPLN